MTTVRNQGPYLETRTDSPDPAVACLLACHDRQPADQRDGPEMVRQFQEVIDAIEADEQVRVVVFDSAVDIFRPIKLSLVIDVPYPLL